jgi:peptide-methionine (S)-S-oxide reductase
MRRLWLLLLVLVAGVAIAGVIADRPVDPPAQPAAKAPGRQHALFAGGCFWCTEADFDHVAGVISTISGYSGGRVANPTYEQVSAGDTGHIEAVRVVYDPRRVSYAALVDHFFRTIDPFDAGGSFCDRGHQYRSAIFVRNAEERRIAEAAKARVERRLGAPVATLILPAGMFYPAEEYHQDYYRKNPVRYRFYRWNCGRDQRLEEVWSRAR